MSEKKYLSLMNQWFIYHQIGYKIENFFSNRHIYTLAIYGMGIYGRHLVRDLENTKVKVLYGIDIKPMNAYKGIQIISSREEFPNADALVYTVLHDGKLKDWLYKKFPGPILSLEEVVFNEEL